MPCASYKGITWSLARDVSLYSRPFNFKTCWMIPRMSTTRNVRSARHIDRWGLISLIKWSVSYDYECCDLCHVWQISRMQLYFFDPTVSLLYIRKYIYSILIKYIKWISKRHVFLAMKYLILRSIDLFQWGCVIIRTYWVTCELLVL